MDKIFKEMEKGFKNFTKKVKESLNLDNLKNLKKRDKNINILILLSGFALMSTNLNAENLNTLKDLESSILANMNEKEMMLIENTRIKSTKIIQNNKEQKIKNNKEKKEIKKYSFKKKIKNLSLKKDIYIETKNLYYTTKKLKDFLEYILNKKEIMENIDEELKKEIIKTYTLINGNNYINTEMNYEKENKNGLLGLFKNINEHYKIPTLKKVFLDEKNKKEIYNITTTIEKLNKLKIGNINEFEINSLQIKRDLKTILISYYYILKNSKTINKISIFKNKKKLQQYGININSSLSKEAEESMYRINDYFSDIEDYLKKVEKDDYKHESYKSLDADIMDTIMKYNN